MQRVFVLWALSGIWYGGTHFGNCIYNQVLLATLGAADIESLGNSHCHPDNSITSFCRPPMSWVACKTQCRLLGNSPSGTNAVTSGGGQANYTRSDRSLACTTAHLTDSRWWVPLIRRFVTLFACRASVVWRKLLRYQRSTKNNWLAVGQFLLKILPIRNSMRCVAQKCIHNLIWGTIFIIEYSYIYSNKSIDTLDIIKSLVTSSACACGYLYMT